MDVRSTQQSIHVVSIAFDAADASVILDADQHRAAIGIRQRHQILGQMFGFDSSALEFHELGFPQLCHFDVVRCRLLPPIKHS